MFFSLAAVEVGTHLIWNIAGLPVHGQVLLVTWLVIAIILGISKALISHDENLKKNLKKDKLTTRDSRVVERKKYGHRKARRSFQFSKR